MIEGPLPSLGSRLDSARAKLRRAERHLISLRQSLVRFSRHEYFRPDAHAYDPGLAGFLKSRVQEETVTRVGGIYLPRPVKRERIFLSEMPLTVTLTPTVDLSNWYLRWGILVGEVVHSICSALDNLAWELAQPLPPVPSPTASSNVRGAYRQQLNNLGFPYTKERGQWPGQCERYLRFVADPVIRSVVEEAQAFVAFERLGLRPDHFPLQVVHDLWNRDKHHSVNVQAAGLQFQAVNVRMPDYFPNVETLAFKVVEVSPIKTLEGTTEMAKLIVAFPSEVEFPRGDFYELNILIKPKFTLAMLFGSGTTAQGLNALEVLGAARLLAFRLVESFA